MARTADVAIIGAGIQGCSAALHCRQRGLSVIVVEKDHAGRHASGVNAGGVRRLNRHPAEIPLSVESSPNSSPKEAAPYPSHHSRLRALPRINRTRG